MASSCQVCSQEKDLKKCTGCGSVEYCSSKCQKEDWKTHKKDCRPFKIISDPVFGKKWIATRDLEPGTLLLDEKPLLYFPWKCGPICLSCGYYCDCEVKKLRECSTCGWPICSPDCEQGPMHKDHECGVFSSQGISFSKIFNQNMDKEQYRLLCTLIIFIRGMGLKKLNPSLYEKLVKEVHKTPEQYSKDYIKNFEKDVDFLRTVVDVKEMMGCPIDNEELFQFRKAVWDNSFDESDYGLFIRGIYLTSSRMNHSCSPNSASNTPFSPFSRRIRTITPVLKGEELNCNYFGVGFEGQSRADRQLETLNRASFLCQCDRCLDPSELGSFMDAMVCVKCQPRGVNNGNSGYFLPVPPIKYDDSAKWQCNGCNMIKPFVDLQTGMYKASRQLEMIKGLDRNERLVFLKVFEEKYQKSFHPNHWILVEADRVLVDYFTEHLKNGNPGNDDKISKAEYQLILEKLEYLTQIDSLISPGLSLSRVEYMNCLSAFQAFFVDDHKRSLSKREGMTLLDKSLATNQELTSFIELDSCIVPRLKTVPYCSMAVDYLHQLRSTVNRRHF